MPAPSVKNWRFSGKKRLKRLRLTTSWSASTWAKSVLNVRSALSDWVRPTRKSAPNSLLQSVGVPASMIDVIPNGIDTEMFANAQPANLENLGIPRGRHVTACVARLDRQKGLDELIHAAPLFLEKPVEDWEREIAQVYAALDIPLSQEALGAMRAEHDRAAGGQHTAHRRQIEEFAAG